MQHDTDTILPDSATLLALSHKAERAAGRRLAQQTGCDSAAALRLAMENAAGGPARLASLLATRQAVRDAESRGAIARQRRRQPAPPHADTSAWRGSFDGSAWPNPGRCAIGALLTGPDGERVAIARTAGHGDSSEAEYRALIALLEAAIEAGAPALAIHGDSKVVIDDVQGLGTREALALAPLRDQARALLARLPGTTLRWVPRHRNGQADALSQQARHGLDGRESTHA